MKWLKSLTMIFSLLGVNGCGVKGDPLPPEKPIELGRGRPTYKGATQGIKIERATSPADDKGKDDDDERQ